MFGKLDEISDIYSSWIITLHKKDTIWVATDQGDFDNPGQKREQLGRKSVWRDASDLTDRCDLPYEMFDNIDDIRKKQKGLVSNERYEAVQRDYVNEASDYIKEGGWASEGSTRFHNQVVHLMKVDLEDKNVDYEICYAKTDRGGNAIRECIAHNKGRVVARWIRDDQILRIFRQDEFLLIPTETLPTKAKLFMILLAGKLIETISTEGYDTPRVMLPSEFIHTKLIGNEVVSTAEPEHLLYWEDAHKMRFKGIVDTLEQLYGYSGALMPVSYIEITKSRHYDNSWLSTIEGNESLAEWITAENQLKTVRSRLWELARREEEDTEELYKMFNDRWDDVLKKAFVAKDITYLDNIDTKNGLSTDINKKSEAFERVGGVLSMKKSDTEEGKLGRGVGKTENKPQVCRCCGIHPSRGAKRLIITHFRELMYLLGVRQAELPPYWQNYRKHTRDSYNGNSLLEQVHPFSDIEDPCSRRHTNGTSIILYVCTRCKKNLDVGKEELEIRLPSKLKQLL